MRSGLEETLGMVVLAGHPVLAWLVAHAADVVRRYQVGEDGRAPHQRMKGLRCNRDIFEFGEQVAYIPLGEGGIKDNWEARFERGAWLGLIWGTDDMILAKAGGGMTKARVCKTWPDTFDGIATQSTAWQL